MKIPASMDGRVLAELLLEKNNQPALQPKKEVLQTGANYKGGRYHLALERTILGKYQYVNFSPVKRTPECVSSK